MGTNFFTTSNTLCLYIEKRDFFPGKLDCKLADSQSVLNECILLLYYFSADLQTNYAIKNLVFLFCQTTFRCNYNFYVVSSQMPHCIRKFSPRHAYLTCFSCIPFQVALDVTRCSLARPSCCAISSRHGIKDEESQTEERPLC